MQLTVGESVTVFVNITIAEGTTLMPKVVFSVPLGSTGPNAGMKYDTLRGQSNKLTYFFLLVCVLLPTISGVFQIVDAGRLAMPSNMAPTGYTSTIKDMSGSDSLNDTATLQFDSVYNQPDNVRNRGDQFSFYFVIVASDVTANKDGATMNISATLSYSDGTSTYTSDSQKKQFQIVVPQLQWTVEWNTTATGDAGDVMGCVANVSHTSV